MENQELYNQLIENLYIQKKQKFFRIAYSIVLNKEDAEDALHEAYTLATANLNKLENMDFFETWFYRILINACRQLLRKSSHYCDNLNEYIGVDDENCIKVENKVYLEDLLKLLNIEHKQVLILKYIEEKSIKEISEILEIPEGTIKSRLFIAIDKIREKIKRKEKYYEL